MKLILAPNNAFFRGMTCDICHRLFSSKDTIWVETTQEFTLQFHTVDGELVCDACAEEHAPEQMAVLRRIHKDVIDAADAARKAEEAERRRIRACIKPGEVAAAAAKLLALGINLEDKAAALAALQPAYEEEAVRDFYVSKSLATALTASDSNADYLPF
jgi:hypothetical protein